MSELTNKFFGSPGAASLACEAPGRGEMNSAAGASLSNQTLAFPKIRVAEPTRALCITHGFWLGTISGRAAWKGTPIGKYI
jgi:hypothetical protein